MAMLFEFFTVFGGDHVGLIAIIAFYILVAIKVLRATKAYQTTTTLVLSMSELLTLKAPCWVGDEGIDQRDLYLCLE